MHLVIHHVAMGGARRIGLREWAVLASLEKQHANAHVCGHPHTHLLQIDAASQVHLPRVNFEDVETSRLACQTQRPDVPTERADKHNGKTVRPLTPTTLCNCSGSGTHAAPRNSARIFAAIHAPRAVLGSAAATRTYTYAYAAAELMAESARCGGTRIWKFDLPIDAARTDQRRVENVEAVGRSPSGVQERDAPISHGDPRQCDQTRPAGSHGT